MSAHPPRIWVNGFTVPDAPKTLLTAHLSFEDGEKAYYDAMTAYVDGIACVFGGAPYVPLLDALAGEQNVYAADLLWHARQLDEDAATYRAAAESDRAQVLVLNEAYDRDDRRYPERRAQLADAANRYRHQAKAADATVEQSERMAHDCRTWALRGGTP